jgi:hypothetical protein
MSAHNLSLPRHRYVWIVPTFVLQDAAPGDDLLPAVWYGVSVQPGRVMGCHVLLESGALIVDLPLHALRCRPDAVSSAHAWRVQDAVRWDGFGWAAEVFEPQYLTGLSARLLDDRHRPTTDVGTLWFCVDHVGDGYSSEPAQHKHLWIVALEASGVFAQRPQDQLLVIESSFTEVLADGLVPRIRRQTQVWTAEP